MEKKYDVLILYSGGADSRLLLQMALQSKKVPYCVLIDYEQTHIKELEFAKKHLVFSNTDYQVVNLHNLKINSSLTNGIGTKAVMERKINCMHVPSRNLMFISIASSIAESKEIPVIWYGADYSDNVNNFIDCKPEWVLKLNEFLKFNSPCNIKVEAPLMGMSKEFILDLLEQTYHIKKEELYSGYEDPIDPSTIIITTSSTNLSDSDQIYYQIKDISGQTKYERYEFKKD